MNEALFPVVLNSSNAIDESTFRYTFPRGSMQFKGDKIALSTLNIFYSWQNIKAEYNNTKFQIIMPDGTPTGVYDYNVNMPDGNYTIEDINRYIQFLMVQQKHYLINAQGEHVYYVEILSNPTYYNIQINLYDIPTTLPAGWTNPGWVLPSTTLKPSFVVLNNGFKDVIGFAPGLYFNTSQVSTKTPEVSPVSSILVSCSLVDNVFSNPNDIIYSFVSGGAKYGSMLNINAQDLVYSNIRDGVYNDFTVHFRDQNFRKLKIKDTSLIIYLVIKITY